MIYMRNKIFFLALSVIALQACFQDEHPVSPFIRTGLNVYSMDSSSIYEKQIFFDLRSNSIVLENDVYSWDLAFECSPDGYRVLINPAKMMTAANFGNLGFTDDISSLDTNWMVDNENGNLDSTAIGTWWSAINGNEVTTKNELYLLNMGYNAKGKKMGYKKLIIDGFKNNNFKIRYADKEGKNVVSADIPKSAGVQFIYFSFNDTLVLNLEPPEETWDLLFTRYTHYYGLEGYEIYGVNGVLLNRKNVKAMQLHTEKEFTDITIEDFVGELSTRRDTIGFDWKYYDLDKSLYLVKTKKYYIIQDYEGYIYKFHFLDFYNKNGEQGFPTFEFMKL
jgi:hypothetical protein